MSLGILVGRGTFAGPAAADELLGKAIETLTPLTRVAHAALPGRGSFTPSGRRRPARCSLRSDGNQGWSTVRSRTGPVARMLPSKRSGKGRNATYRPVSASRLPP